MHIQQVTTTAPMEMMGNVMPGRVDTAQIWFSKDKMSIESPEATSIVRNDLGMLYILMPNKKTYSEIPLSDFAAAQQEMEKMAPDSVKGKNPMGKMSAKVTVTDQTKKIGDWNCRLYHVEASMPMGMTATQEIWATKDVDVDYQALFKAMSGMMAGFEGFEEAMTEMEKVDGLPIQIDMSMNVMGATVKSMSEVISAKDETPPEGNYDVPYDYTKVERTKISPH